MSAQVNLEKIPIDDLLKMALDSNKEKMDTGMIYLNKIAENNLSLFLQKMGQILSDEEKASDIRQLSAILIKNSLLHVEGFINIWREKIPQEEKSNIKNLVLSSLASNKKEIRTSASTVISSICKIDSPITKTWPELLPSLTSNAFHENINLKLAAIETLGYVCEELTIKTIDQESVDKIMNALIQNLTNEEKEEKVVIQLLKSLYYSIKLAENLFSKNKGRGIIMNAIFQIGTKYEKNEDVLERIAMLFIEMLSYSNYYDYIEDCFDQIMTFSFNLIQAVKETNDRLALLCLEIICCIGDEEASRLSTFEITVITGRNGFNLDKTNKFSKKYFTKICKQLQQLIVGNVSVPEDDEDENEWNISKACLYILSLMAQVVEYEEIKNFYSDLYNHIKNSLSDDSERSKCWLLLGSSISKNNKTELNPIITEFLKVILEDIQNIKNTKLRRCASYLIYKIIKIFPKILEVCKLSQVINVLTDSIKNSNNDSLLIMNLCKCLQIIIKTYGDLETNKSSCVLSNYFETIFKGLFINANTEIISSKETTKASLSRLMTIGTLIDYSSHDKQVQIKEIIIQFIKEINSTQESINALISKGYSKDTVFQIQEYYYTLLQKLFKKYKSILEPEIGNEVWRLTKGLFSYRGNVFEESNLALGALARNMGKSFTPIFVEYYPYIEFSIKSFSNDSLSKSGLIALKSCITSTADAINKPKEITEILIQVCASNDVARANKIISIGCLGEIALIIGPEFQPSLQTVMKLLFSAAQMGINIPEGTDEEIIEFVKNLRNELIQTFTCLECTFYENKDLLTPYIRDIFEFLKLCIYDNNIQRFDILKNTLCLIVDLFQLYGNEFKELCNIDVSKKLIETITYYNGALRKTDPYVEQNIDLLKSYY